MWPLALQILQTALSFSYQVATKWSSFLHKEHNLGFLKLISLEQVFIRCDWIEQSMPIR